MSRKANRGLIAARVGAAVVKKAGLLAVLLAFGKKIIVFLLIGLAVVGNWIRRLFGRRGEDEVHYEEAPATGLEAQMAPETPAEAVPGEGAGALIHHDSAAATPSGGPQGGGRRAAPPSRGGRQSDQRPHRTRPAAQVHFCDPKGSQTAPQPVPTPRFPSRRMLRSGWKPL